MSRRLTLPTLLLFALPLASQGVLPAGRAGDVAGAWFEAYNAHDEARMRGFFERYRTSEKQAEFAAVWEGLARLQAQAGRLTPSVAELVSSALLRVEAEAESLPTAVLLTFQLGDETPALLANLELRPGRLADVVDAPTEWDSLAELAEKVRADAGVPALAVATIAGGRILETAVVGRRSVADEGATALLGDRFHLGSITKSMTASMIGRLVEDGLLEFDVRLGDVLEDVDMWPEYAESSLLEVLQHRAGLPAHLVFDDAEFTRLNGFAGTPTEQRGAYVREVLGTEPEQVGGFRYSNAGYAVAGYVAERVTGRSWESLVQEHVFDALRLTSAGFDWPATPERRDEPRGHFRDPEGLRPQTVDEYVLGAFMHPAGDTHASVRDLARFATAHLNGLVGRADFLLPATVRRLHEPLPGAPYACGWLVREGVHAHNGSTGTFHAMMELDPAADRGFVLLTNTSDFQDTLAAALRTALMR